MAPKYTRPDAPVPSAWPTGTAYIYAEDAADESTPPVSALVWREFITDTRLRQIIETARLREGDPLNLSVGKDGAVIIRPARQKYRLEDLVAEITPGNRHDETDWGEPVGKEIW